MDSSMMKRGVIVLAIALSVCAGTFAQAAKPTAAKIVAAELAPVKSSPAYAELQLKRTEVFSDLESLLLEYTEEFPKVKEFKNTLLLLDRDIARISKVKVGEASKLSLALGKLMLRRIELETDLWNLQKSYKDEHPDVKRAKRKVEIYESAISDILN
jgi:hypothetical protein